MRRNCLFRTYYLYNVYNVMLNVELLIGTRTKTNNRLGQLQRQAATFSEWTQR